MGNRIRIHIYIYGRVQGVFYRRSAKMKANSLGLFGWVKNIDDGSVEAMVEGDRVKVDEFIKWAKKGPPFARVDKVEVEKFKSLENFPKFEIFF